MEKTAMHPIHQDSPLSAEIWNMKYRLKAEDGTPVDRTVEDTWRRVANALAEGEAEENRAEWARTFYDALSDFKFLPGGRITAGAGTAREVTLFNCFVMGTIPDSLAGIFDMLKEAALTMQQGGGIGYDFSTLRPKGALVKGVGADASGPLSFMDVWDSMCKTIMSAGTRRGAMMATMRCDHPDIEDFITAKQDRNRLRMFNVSVLVTDAFMEAVKADASWDLVFKGKVYKTVQAKDLWNKIMRSTYAYAEPGVIFIDRINKDNNLNYCETISATNPCGEIPLPPYGACLLGSMNLTAFVKDPFTPQACIDLEALDKWTRVAVRMLDNAITVSKFPLESQTREAHAKRRMGLGITGLADALIMMGAVYGSDEAVRLTDLWMKTLTHACYKASALLAKEKGSFPLYDEAKYLSNGFVSKLDEEIKALIRQHGMRNALLTSIAPTGTISLFAGNVSSGLEPVFDFNYSRNVLQPDGSRIKEEVSDFAYRLYRKLKGQNAELTPAFIATAALDPIHHVRMQAAVQKWIDNSISKTVNCPVEISFEDFSDVYMTAYEMGCKGCTTYRPNDVTGAVLEVKEESKAADAKAPEALPAPANDTAKANKLAPRGEMLIGRTYKLAWPESDHSLYITINDSLEEGEGGRKVRAPFEMFINSKNMDYFAWAVGLTRMVSAVFRRGGDVSFVVEELKSVFDPRGGSWMAGRYVPSLLAAIGDIVEKHLSEIEAEANAARADQWNSAYEIAPQVVEAKAVTAAVETPVQEAAKDVVGGATVVALSETAAGKAMAKGTTVRGKTCPKCHQPTLIKQEGCEKCTDCGYSKCG